MSEKKNEVIQLNATPVGSEIVPVIETKLTKHDLIELILEETTADLEDAVEKAHKIHETALKEEDKARRKLVKKAYKAEREALKKLFKLKHLPDAVHHSEWDYDRKPYVNRAIGHESRYTKDYIFIKGKCLSDNSKISITVSHLPLPKDQEFDEAALRVKTTKAEYMTACKELQTFKKKGKRAKSAVIRSIIDSSKGGTKVLEGLSKIRKQIQAKLKEDQKELT